MIILTKDKKLENYFIDENGIITDKDGVIQKTSIHKDNRLYFNNFPVHKIMMYTFYEYRDGHKWAIHHIDENKLNNKINNLIYLTHSEHTRLHHIGKKQSKETVFKKANSYRNKNFHHSIETKIKLSEAQKGKRLSEETKIKIGIKSKGRHHNNKAKDKIRNWQTGKRMYNNGVINKWFTPNQVPDGFIEGMIKR